MSQVAKKCMMTELNIKYNLDGTGNSKWNTLKEILVTLAKEIIPRKERDKASRR